MNRFFLTENMTTTINTYKELKDEVANKKVLVFGGFSGLGYADQERLLRETKERINKEIESQGKDNVVVVCGATSDGIGAVYKVAKELGVTTYGVVSEAGKEYGSDKDCDKTFFVPDPKGTWQVLSEKGDSYMVDIAAKNGVLVYYGGGDVAVSEIKEAKQKGIAIETDVSFEPNPIQVEKKKTKNPNFDPTPLRSFVEKESVFEKINTIRSQNVMPTSGYKPT